MDQEKYEKLIELISKQLELSNEFSQKFIKEALDIIIRFDKKHSEKGMGAYNKFGPFGVLVKMDEKYSELLESYNSKTSFPKDVLEKDWEDISVYALMGLLIEKGEWKN